MSEITFERLEILQLIDKLSSKSAFGLTNVKDIIKVIMEERKIKTLSVRKQISDCKKMGLIENPIHGGWKLTDKGKGVLEKIK